MKVKKLFTVLSLVIILSLAMTLISGDNITPNNWPTFRGNVQHTGYYSGHAPLELSGLTWKFKTGAGVSSDPTVVDGMVFFGSHDGYLYALK
ncbi:MAG: PQQ-binding-like beta-propeller repeat protein [Exilispira sp.]|nr:PQQ-binding-like beta-propeller repeat protein [Exilispira sp.]